LKLGYFVYVLRAEAVGVGRWTWQAMCLFVSSSRQLYTFNVWLFIWFELERLILGMSVVKWTDHMSVLRAVHCTEWSAVGLWMAHTDRNM